MAIRTIVTRGYGSFGTIGEVVTRGYTPGEAIEEVDAIHSLWIWDRYGI